MIGLEAASVVEVSRVRRAAVDEVKVWREVRSPGRSFCEVEEEEEKKP